MTRLIERWFPCKEVSENSKRGWGRGNVEKELFPWFAARPLAQARAAVICSLLPWPDEPVEQAKLQDLVRRAMEGYDAAHHEIIAEINKYYPDGATLLDSFSGRSMIPLEAARLGIKSWGIDYSPVATLGGTLLADYPMRDWSQEPPLPFDGYEPLSIDRITSSRLLYDVEYILTMVGSRYESEMAPFYPKVNGKQPWGYLWAITLPCVNCGKRFPITGNLELRKPNSRKDDPGQSYYIETNGFGRYFKVIVHDGPPRSDPTLVKKEKQNGRVAVCIFCDHVHAHKVHTRLVGDGYAGDVLLVVADLDKRFGKLFRDPVQREFKVIKRALQELNLEASFPSGLPAIPNEKVLGSTGGREYARYGYYTFGDFCNARQTLALVKLSRIINDVGVELSDSGVSSKFVAALSGYAAAVLLRMISRTTRGASLKVLKGYTGPGQIFSTGPSVPFGSDYFEVSCGRGPGTWFSLARGTIRALRKQTERIPGLSVSVQQGTATVLPMPDGCLDAVVTDPPYDSMVEYSDASDIFYVWLKRALAVSHPEFGVTSNSVGVQDKTDEVVVERTWRWSGDHRTPDHYYHLIVKALAEARRVIKDDGVVTIIFGHDNPDVWKRFLTSIDKAGLVLTGSWPARTETGMAGKAHIETTLTLSCRLSDQHRPVGHMTEVDVLVQQEVLARIPLWQEAGLALQDQRMASYGPAMEVVGRYSVICDKAGKPVSLDKYLAKARRYVEEEADIKIGDTPLEKFDLRSHFGLFWAYMHGRSIVSGSEARWLRLGWDMTENDTAGLLKKVGQGFRLIYGREVKKASANPTTIIDTALAVAAVGKSSKDITDIITATDRVDDDLLWDSMNHLAKYLTATDNDGEVWTWAVRNRSSINSFSQEIAEKQFHETKIRKDAGIQQGML